MQILLLPRLAGYFVLQDTIREGVKGSRYALAFAVHEDGTYSDLQMGQDVNDIPNLSGL